jgi:hypothetical protein
MYIRRFICAITLKVNDGVYEKLIGLLSKFNKEEVEIISGISDFMANKNYLSEELTDILNGKVRFIDINETELRFENIIKKDESNI